MAALLSSDPMHSGMHEGGPYKQSDNKPEENGGRWYFSRKEIEENSPSRSDGIDLKKETYLRKSYCTFLQDLGMRLKVCMHEFMFLRPQVTIATAIIFCHRFFLRQSHAKNDRRTVATVCMFLAGKVEETPRPLKDVILVSYEINHKKDPEAVQRIKQKEVYEQQKELILTGERVVLATLAFDFNVHHPYKPLVEAIKKFKVAQNALAQVAWNFVNDGACRLRTSLCLQFKPHHIAAGAIFLAAKFLKVKLPSDGEKVWWQEFNVTPRQLEEVSNQMLELYEQNRMPPSQTSEVLDGSTGGGVTQKARPPAVNEEHGANDSDSHVGATSISGTSNPASSRPTPDQLYQDNGGGHPRTSQDHSNDDGSTDRNKDIISDVENNDDQHCESENGDGKEGETNSMCGPKRHEVEDQEFRGQNVDYRSQPSPKDAIRKIDKDKVRAALEKRRKARGGDVSRRTEFMDEDDLIERELEDGVELAAESEKSKQERKQSWLKPSNLDDKEVEDFEAVEEGEVGMVGEGGGRQRSPLKSGGRKRKTSGSPPLEKRRRN
ncbi:cyclin-T1-3-like isoform X3 [Cynara cardunculus var. scolymus]|uniref:cyclin-T1-3-like isoform X3 n=1 Tax=Cynara cardunculus var. scolymus TaxID=59895 RepID=UPI000D6262EA|nr:cyclin-T1-3-like isoform X3 [Cynara cardunculus var. scolymus]